MLQNKTKRLNDILSQKRDGYVRPDSVQKLFNEREECYHIFDLATLNTLSEIYLETTFSDKTQNKFILQFSDHFASLYYDKENKRFIVADTMSYDKTPLTQFLEKNKELLKKRGYDFNEILILDKVYSNGNNDCATNVVTNLKALDYILEIAKKNNIKPNERFVKDSLRGFYSPALAEKVKMIIHFEEMENEANNFSKIKKATKTEIVKLKGEIKTLQNTINSLTGNETQKRELLVQVAKTINAINRLKKPNQEAYLQIVKSIQNEAVKYGKQRERDISKFSAQITAKQNEINQLNEKLAKAKASYSLLKEINRYKPTIEKEKKEVLQEIKVVFVSNAIDIISTVLDKLKKKNDKPNSQKLLSQNINSLQKDLANLTAQKIPNVNYLNNGSGITREEPKLNSSKLRPVEQGQKLQSQTSMTEKQNSESKLKFQNLSSNTGETIIKKLQEKIILRKNVMGQINKTASPTIQQMQNAILIDCEILDIMKKLPDSDKNKKNQDTVKAEINKMNKILLPKHNNFERF